MWFFKKKETLFWANQYVYIFLYSQSIGITVGSVPKGQTHSSYPSRGRNETKSHVIFEKDIEYDVMLNQSLKVHHMNIDLMTKLV